MPRREQVLMATALILVAAAIVMSVFTLVAEFPRSPEKFDTASRVCDRLPIPPNSAGNARWQECMARELADRGLQPREFLIPSLLGAVGLLALVAGRADRRLALARGKHVTTSL
jgi:hypothetical protein